MSLEQLLRERNIRKALVVDDACDEVPTAADMRVTAGREWANFVDDLDDDHRELIRETYPESEGVRFGDLTGRDEYVAAIWSLRDRLGEIADRLFEAYDSTQARDLSYVFEAKERLERLGVEVETRGRGFADAANDADLILIDLYFGASQDESALADSKTLLRDAVLSRIDNPPLVILMSRSGRLESKRDEFRDEVGLVDSGFRIILKSELGGERLERQLERLAQNADDTRKLARFFAELDRGIQSAALRTLTLMRTLKLSDIGQIQELLLNVEGEPTGSYLVDVFDRVLLHEIEAEVGIIEAALAVNDFSVVEHPPPYVAGSGELQELVARMQTQNPTRLELPGAVGGLVAFGDLLRPSRPAGSAASESKTLSDLTDKEILLVLTPACDLQRSEAPRILLLVGSIHAVSAQNWTYGSSARTSAVRAGDEMFGIEWNLKHLETVSWRELEEAKDSGDLRVVARLREAHALELQQRVLSNLGRVGLVSAMPATFAVEVDAYIAGTDGVPVRIDVPALAEGAVCFVGRDENGKPYPRLVLTEAACDDLQAALDGIQPEQVSERSRKALGHIQSSGDLRRVLASGLTLKGVGSKAWSQIGSLTGLASGLPKMGLVSWNYAFPDEPLQKDNLAKAGILLAVRDSKAEGSIGLTEMLRLGVGERGDSEIVVGLELETGMTEEGPDGHV